MNHSYSNYEVYTSRTKNDPNADSKNSFLQKVKFNDVSGDRLKIISRQSMNGFINTIYYNFEELSEYPQLKHTVQEIGRLLTSSGLVMFTVSLKDVMIGYCIGEMMKLDDERNVLFISYIFVSKKYRGDGIGSIFIKDCVEYAKQKGLEAIVLICDTEDQKVLDFYLKKGFMYDLKLRRYDKYDVLSLNIN